MKKLLFLFLVLFLLTSSAIAKHDPSFLWSTLETPHFAVHYHQGLEDTAKRVAVIAEDVHARLVPRMQWEPFGRTQIVLVDSEDSPNGLTTSLPYNIMTLYLTQPLGEPGFGAHPYEEWLRLLITHEYTHVLQLDMTFGVPGVMKHIFGRLYFPNMFQPVWLIEGLATYEETEQTSGGRGRSAGADMVLRMAVLEDRFPRLSQAAVFPDRWPSGEVPYLFGESFTRYIAQKYGREKLAQLSTAYSRHGVPWFADLNGRRVLGAWYSDLWDEWRGHLRDRYSRQRDGVLSRGMTASLALTKRGFRNSYPAISPDGTRIAYMVQNADEFPGIYVMNIDGTGDRKLVENIVTWSASGGGIAWSPTGDRLYYTKAEIENNTNLYNDIYYYDLRKNREYRLTAGLRARDPHPSPDGTSIVFVTNKLAMNRIASLVLPAGDPPVDAGTVRYLTGDSLNQYESPRVSPDGSTIAIGVWQPGGYKDIWLLDTQGNKVDELARDRAIDGGAAWSPDGRTLFFSSDRTGIFNLYAYERETKKTWQVTNVLGGAFTPALSPDGKQLAFTSYSSTGYDVHIRPADAASWKPAEPYADPYPVVGYKDAPVAATGSSYDPLPTLAPRFWIPWAGASSESGTLLGLFTFGQDAVERHRYILQALYSPSTYRKWYAFNYTYDGLVPTIQISASDFDGTYSELLTDPSGTADYVQKERVYGVSLLFPLLKMSEQHAIVVGYRHKYISPLSAYPPWTGYAGDAPATGTMVSARVRYRFSSAKMYGFSISPEGGRTVDLGHEKIDRRIGGDFTLGKYTADWHEYLDLPWKHQVLQVRLFGGYSHGDVVPQGAYQLGGDNPGNATLSVDDESVYLRGYPVNSFRGNRAALGSLEYRFPVKDIELGISSTPMFFRRVHGAVFCEAGNAYDGSFRSSEFKRSVGAEARLDMDLAYRLPITLRIVLVKGLDDKGESAVYFSLWMPGLL